jgi:hypothetical protein
MVCNSLSERLSKLLQNESLAIDWDNSQKLISHDGLFFLTPDFIAENCGMTGLGSDVISFLQSVADIISRDNDMVCLAWHCHYLLFLRDSYDRGLIGKWPSLDEFLGKYSGAFYLLVALSGIPKAMTFHQARRIPEKIMRDTYTDTAIWARDYRDLHGVWGINTHILPWLCHHLSGDLFRLMRLQFMQRPFRQSLRAFRNYQTHEVMVLSEPGIRYRGDGQIGGTGGVHDPMNGWTSRVIIENDYITGTFISPKGMALSKELSLPLNKWECILTPGDPILEVHIPAGEKMDFHACGESFKLAVDFFPKYFPDRPFKAFCCGSWLLNTQFQDMLPPESNIVRFQKEFYLFPIYAGGRSGVERIFRSGLKDLSTAPRDTSLRRAVLDHLQAGGYLRAGGGLFFAEDLNWGAQVYRNDC